MSNILIVDDEKEIADLIEIYLKNENYNVYKYYSSEHIMNDLENIKIDLAILDIMMPGVDGFSLCEEIRKKYNFPIIFVTAKVENIDKISGFAIGADDYVTKPFEPLELVARVKAQIRRYKNYNKVEENEEVIDFRNIVINNNSHEFYFKDKKILLTPIEFSIMWYLCKNRGTTVKTEDLLDVEKRMNQIKKQARKNLRLAQENEQRKNDLIVYLAHDIKTPLTSMIGYLSLLNEINDMPLKQRVKYINIALEKSYRLEDLINELFDISRFNAEIIILSKEELNLTMMLEQIVDDFYPILKENNKEITIKSDDKIIIYADSDKIARVFGNIIKNAINYSINNDKIEIEVKKDNQNVIVKVKNKGAKIPEEKLKRIFEKSYRADSSRTSKTGGSGLGLAIAKEIVELHNGKIIATSNDLETVFEVVLPLCKN